MIDIPINFFNGNKNVKQGISIIYLLEVTGAAPITVFKLTFNLFNSWFLPCC